MGLEFHKVEMYILYTKMYKNTRWGFKSLWGGRGGLERAMGGVDKITVGGYPHKIIFVKKNFLF